MNRAIWNLAGLFVSSLVTLIASPALAQPAAGAARPAEAAAADHRMDWWREARFGMFIHWGIYSVPAGVWKGENFPGAAEWLMDSAKIPVSDYEPLAAQFNPVDFDAATWVGLAKSAGMKYIVITSKHHDGFCMWGTKLTPYNIVDATPYKRDPLKELAAECKKQGMKLCFYYSIMDWHHPDARGATFPKYFEHLKGQITELLTNYGDIGVMWFDGEWIPEWNDTMGRELYALCRKLQPSILVNNRVGKGRDGMAGMNKDPNAPGDFGTPEQEVPAGGFPGVDWETCMPMNGSWGFHQNDTNWKSSAELLGTLVETASKGGNFLLNVGPTARGEIPAESVDRLLLMGLWLKANGESIYGSTGYPGGAYMWGDCTVKPGHLYLNVLEAPVDGQVVMRGIKNKVLSASFLESGVAIDATSDGESITVPGVRSRNTPGPTVIRLDIEGTPATCPRVFHVTESRKMVPLSVFDARVNGKSLRLERDPAKRCLGFWSDPNDTVSWDVELTRPGVYNVILDYSCDAKDGGGSLRVIIGDQTVSSRPGYTEGWTTFTQMSAPAVWIAEPGRYVLVLQPEEIRKHALMNLRGVYLQYLREH